ncbi:hypothetical protein OG974_05090 [Streptomyces sp. NBC_00597]|uniref:hypothetical protein n=1 Tax=Streptomyces sp. NBC_00597 TaxID=2975786 RepID=UPI0030DE34E6
MTALSQVGANYLLHRFDLPALAGNSAAVAVTVVLLLAAVTSIACLGPHVAACVQYMLLGLQPAALVGFGAAALARDGERVAGQAAARGPAVLRAATVGRSGWIMRRRGGARPQAPGECGVLP